MKIDIWSDVVCPFCYIGKRHLELALEQFPHKDSVEIEWHSFELDPKAAKEYPGDVYDMLSEKYEVSREQARQMNGRVLQMAEAAGLHYNLDDTKPGNSFDAHRLIHLAAQHKLQDKAEERLFTAYFMEGKRISDAETLLQLGKEIGLPEAEVKSLLESDTYADAVRADEKRAGSYGISGVPFFVMEGKYGISGAQPVQYFLQALETVWEEANPAGAATPENDVSCTDDNCAI